MFPTAKISIFPRVFNDFRIHFDFISGPPDPFCGYLEVSWESLGPFLGSSWRVRSHLGAIMCDFMPFWGYLWASWGVLGLSGGHFGAYLGHLGAVWGHLEAISGLSWGHSGPLWGQLGAILDHLGVKMPSNSQNINFPYGFLMIFGPILISSWGLLRPFWGHLGPFLGLSWGLLGPSWGHFGVPVGPSWGPSGPEYNPTFAFRPVFLK